MSASQMIQVQMAVQPAVETEHVHAVQQAMRSHSRHTHGTSTTIEIASSEESVGHVGLR
jgi:hypothetical protein